MKQIAFLLLLFFLRDISYSQDTFKKLLLNPGLNPATTSGYINIKPTPDNGYVIMKVIDDSINVSDTHLLVLKYNACDILLWSKAIVYDIPACPSTFTARDFMVTKKGEIIIALGGDLSCFTYNFIIKLSPSGQEIATKKFTWESGEYFQIDQAANGDYILSSFRFPKGMYVCRFTEDFNIIWCKKYKYDVFLFTTKDNGIMFYSHNVITKLNENGVPTWCVKIENFEISDIVEINSGFVLISHINNLNNYYDVLKIMKLDFDGNIAWIRDPFWFSDSTFNVIGKSSLIKNGSNLIVLADLMNMNSIHQYVLSELNLEGKMQRQIVRSQNLEYKRYYPEHVITHPNKGYLICGRFVNLPPAGKSEFAQILLDKVDFDITSNQCGFQTIENSNNLTQLDPILSDFEFLYETSSIYFSDFNLTIVDRYLTEVVECSQDFSIDFSSDTTLCFGETLQLESKRSYDTYLWSTGATTKSIEVTKPGLYILKATDECRIDTDSILVDFYPDPQVDFSVEPKVASIFEDIHFKSLTKSPGKVIWKIGIGYEIPEYDFDYRYSINGNFNIKYIFEDPYGCIFKDATDILIKHISISIPNSFTPNGDDLNEEFEPIGFGIRSYNMVIYNRWGGMAFESTNKSWDGGQAPPGKYPYQIEILDEFGETIHKQGMVQLLR
jgi:gliding motility-associated-like protein